MCSNKDSTVDAYNIWGGKASQIFDVDNSASQDTYDYSKVAILVLLISLTIFGYVFVRRYWREFAATIGFGDSYEGE